MSRFNDIEARFKLNPHPRMKRCEMVYRNKQKEKIQEIPVLSPEEQIKSEVKLKLQSLTQSHGHFAEQKINKLEPEVIPSEEDI